MCKCGIQLIPGFILYCENDGFVLYLKMKQNKTNNKKSLKQTNKTPTKTKTKPPHIGPVVLDSKYKGRKKQLLPQSTAI